MGRISINFLCGALILIALWWLSNNPKHVASTKTDKTL
jgi:hypothetical protein